LLIYPNPTYGIIILSNFESLINNNVGFTVFVYSIDGNELFREWFLGLSNNETIDLSFLIPGIYLLRIQSFHDTINRHIVVK
jgi:hypothetical protein